MALMLNAEDIHKTYVMTKGSLHVLNGASLEIAEGETVAIVGRSGAGKSTLLHVLGGLDHPDSGEVVLMGRRLYSLSSAHRTRIRAAETGFVFQSYHLLPEMDVMENVMLPSMALGGLMTRSRMRNKAKELLKSVGLEERCDHTPMELSGGEQQRVAVARSLMNEPRIIFADEPTGNLDSSTGGQVLDHLFSMVKSRGLTLVMVTHNEQIARSCNRVLRLENGRLV